MKIAIAANGDSPVSQVPEKFEESAYLLIVETDDGSYNVFKNPEGQGDSGLPMTQEIVKQDCEALISGSIEEPAFEELVMAQVTRYLGANHRVMDALNLMAANELDIIRVPNGEEWVPHNHDHATCNCGNHED